jgi:hypothetical protein
MSSTFQIRGYDPAFPDGKIDIERVKIAGTISPSEYAKRTMKEWEKASSNTIKMPAEVPDAPTLDEIKESLNLQEPPNYEIPKNYIIEPVDLPSFPTKSSITISGVGSL